MAGTCCRLFGDAVSLIDIVHSGALTLSALMFAHMSGQEHHAHETHKSVFTIVLAVALGVMSIMAATL